MAYRLSAAAPPIVAALSRRAWMDATFERFAYRCLPLQMASQAGWFILNTHTVRVTWDGGDDAECVKVEYETPLPRELMAVSYFGHGIVTWIVPILFRTPLEFMLLARGPANYPKQGAYPLEGLVETDWAVATFTMNWQMMEPGQPVIFRRDEPICMIVPHRKGDLERFVPVSTTIDAAPELAKQWRQWTEERLTFMKERGPGEWQKHYFQGRVPSGAPVESHKTKLHLQEFRSD